MKLVLLIRRSLFFFMMLCSASTLAHSPFSLADTSSPKHTLVNFLYYSEIVIKHWQAESLESKEAKHAYNQAIRTMDLSLVPNRTRTVVMMERIILLREILDRFDSTVLQAAPDHEKAQDISYWRFANSDLSIVRLETGNRQGQFVFSANTVQQLSSWYRKMEAMPYALASRTDYYQEFLVTPGPLFSKSFIYALPDDFVQLYGPLPLWQWFALLGIFVLCKLLIRVSFKLGECWNSYIVEQCHD